MQSDNLELAVDVFMHRSFDVVDDQQTFYLLHWTVVTYVVFEEYVSLVGL